MENGKTVGGRYRQLESLREPFLTRARDAAKLTIPSLMPQAGHSGSSKLPAPYQGIGARGLNNLASKLLLTLFPPNSPFFRLQMDDYTLQELAEDPDMRSQVEDALSTYERAVMTEFEASALRVSAFEAIKQLINSGNCLLYLPPEGGMRVYRLDRYVVKRDPMGKILEIIVKEEVAPDSLPRRAKALLDGSNDNPQKSVDLFTYVHRNGNHWKVYQEINGKTVPKSEGSYPLENNPYIPLRWTRIDGESYGRGYVEEFYGDLNSLEALTKAIVQGSAAAAKVLFLLDPNGTTKVKALTESESGDVRQGRATDVSVLQMEKYADFRVAQETRSEINERLSYAFLLNSSVQRDAERVTAEEVRYMADELEDALGGVYSILSLEFQLPLVKTLMSQMQKAGKVPQLPEGAVSPSIVTGLEALGRGHDLQRLTQFIRHIEVFGPEVIAQYLNVSDYIRRTGSHLGLDMDGLVRSEEEVAQQQKQQQMAQLQDRLGPEFMKIIQQQQENQQNASAPAE